MRPLDEQAALRAVVEGTSAHTGGRFFEELVRNLAQALGTRYAWATEYAEEEQRLRALAFWHGDDWMDEYEYRVPGTPCEPVVERKELVFFPEKLLSLFPDDPDLEPLGAVSYMGVPFLDQQGRVVGHLAVMDCEPMKLDPQAKGLFEIFANRGAAELRRLRAEQSLREREQELQGLIDGAMDAIVELDSELETTLVNSAGEIVLGAKEHQIRGSLFSRFLDRASTRKLRELMAELDEQPLGKRHLWIPGGLQAKRLDGSQFNAEATLSFNEVHRKPRYTLILRNVDDRLNAERRIRSLTEDKDYLKEELALVHDASGIVGDSESFVEVLRKVSMVAPARTSVLITGETGTGKELIARAVHEASGRGERPLVKVNCAAIPASLIESEFFGHEKGAFTGASKERVGRFELADGGTLFLDEVGEIPLDLQSKLLRVLQEGEFERVGENQTRSTDVRVVAATNRNLEEECEKGNFREDLFYRLNVFPIHVPPLRERQADAIKLAQHFLEKFARDMNRDVPVLSSANRAALLAYNWPGNVRELQNLIERAMITCQGGELQLDLQGSTSAAGQQPHPTALAIEPGQVLSEHEMQERVASNLRAALAACDGQVYGPDGAAELLGVKPTTLAARLKKLGIQPG